MENKSEKQRRNIKTKQCKKWTKKEWEKKRYLQNGDIKKCKLLGLKVIVFAFIKVLIVLFAKNIQCFFFEATEDLIADKICVARKHLSTFIIIIWES